MKNKKHIIYHYTIVEVMVAMGIFLVMMTIMMQFFTSAQQMWNISAKRNDTYADARVAMNLMTREIQCMLYRNDATDGTGIYPFWYEWTDINDDLTGSETRPQEIKDYFIDNNDLFEYGASGSGNPYLTALNFIANTDVKSVDKGSDVCEIRYKFIPVYFSGSTPYSINSVEGGKLKRSCTEEYYDTSTLTNDEELTDKPYNFADYYYQGAVATVAALPTRNGTAYQERVKTIWRNLTADINVAPFRTIISGVYSLRFTCYVWDTTNGKLITLDPMYRNTSGTLSPGDAPDNAPVTVNASRPYAYDLATGTNQPVAVRIDMKLLAPEDLKKLAFNIYVAQNGSTTEKKDARKQIRTLKQKMRTFSKVIYLGKRE